MQRPIAAMLALLFVGGIVAVAVGVAGTIVSLNSGSTHTSDLSVPPGWPKHYSSEGLSLTIDQPSGQVYSGVHVRGTVSPKLAKLNDKVTIQFWTEGAFRALPKDEESKYKGYIDSGTVTAYVGPDGSFDADIMKVPPAVRVNGELRLTEPGRHWYALILDDKHATFAPFDVTAPRPYPTVSQEPYFSANSFWFLDNKTGWLSASSCRNQLRPTPDQYGNEPVLPPPICKPALYGTTDGGQRWTLLYHGPLEGFHFASPTVGVAYNNTGSCPKGPCRSQILRTTDGGRTWTQTYQPLLSLGDLTMVGGEPWLVGSDCDESTPRSTCTSYLLRSSDAGATWIQTTLPVAGRPYLSMSRPTAHDAWIAPEPFGHKAAQILTTHDDGVTWQALPQAPSLDQTTVVSFRTATEGWLLTGGQPSGPFQSKKYFRTTDGGLTWTQVLDAIRNPTPGYVGPLTFASDHDIWIPVDHIGLSHSADGGMTWTSVAVGGRNDDQRPVLQFADPQHGWTMSNYYSQQPLQLLQALWSTSDGGATWQELPLPTPEP